MMNSSAQQIVGSVEFLDPKMEVFFDKNAKIEVLADGLITISSLPNEIPALNASLKPMYG